MMAAEIREYAITIGVVGAMALGGYIVYSFAVSQGWISPLFRYRLTRMKSARALTNPRRYGQYRTEKERAARHLALYGTTEVPPKGTFMRRLARMQG